MLTSLRSKAAALVALALSFFVSGVALAEGGSTFDVTDATSTLSGVESGLIAVGGVLIGLAAVAVGFKWIKGMIFG